MTEDTRRRAEAARKDIEDVTSVVLPEPGAEPVGLEQADAQTSAEIRKRMDEIDLTDSGSICNNKDNRFGKLRLAVQGYAFIRIRRLLQAVLNLKVLGV